MTRIVRSKDCGNSPKNRLLEDLSIAIARADSKRIDGLLSKDVRWLQIGRQPIAGIDAVRRAVTRYGPASAFTIEHVVSHGTAGAVNGYVEWGEKRRAFCHMFEFGNAKGAQVKAITTYSIGLRAR